jgi:hypothetical protein
MKFLAIQLLAIITLALSSSSLAKHDNKNRSSNKAAAFEVEIHRNGKAPVLDGVLSKNEWENAAVIYSFTQKEPGEGQPASEPTFVLITYDYKNIYFGIRCFDKEPQKIVANEMRRDYDLSNNDYFEIIIDTFYDQRNAYYFATNSLGARLDSEIKSEGTHINWDWDGIWQSIARKDDYGWTAEIAIPFKTLRFKDSKNITWGINFGRYIARKREQAYWSPISRNDDFDGIGKFKVSKFGVLRGLRNIKQEHWFQIKPYTISGLEKNFQVGSPLKKVTDIGLDTKIRITSNVISDITVNTDFAQVEADQEQVNLSRFSLFFPEKRDFFLEGLDIFNVGEGSFSNPLTLLFFSRRIGLNRDSKTFELNEVPILGGIKLTGKEGPLEIGFLDVYTKDLKYTNLNNNPVQIPGTNYAALRIKQDIFQRSYVGFIGLSKDPKNGRNYNRTFALDGLFSFNNNIRVSGYLAKTKTPGLNGKDLNGFVDLSWGSDKVFTQATFTDIGKNFNPEMGFLQWRDIRKYKGLLTLSPRPNILNIRQSHFSNQIEYITDHKNELQYRTFQTGLLNIFQDESYLFLGLTNFYDNVPASGFFLGPAFIPGGIYKFNVFGITYNSDRSRNVAGKIRFGNGSFYDGTFTGLTLTSYLRPNDKFGVDLSWNWNRVAVPFPNGKFTTSILSARFKYSFTPDLFVKTFIQWNDFQKRIISNFLLNFIHTPGSDFYFVYNEEWSTNGGIHTVNRAVVAKLTYLLNL